MDIAAARKRCEAAKLSQERDGWVLALNGVIIAHFMDEEDARLFKEAIPAALEALGEAQQSYEAMRHDWYEEHEALLEAQGKLEALIKAGVTDYSKLTGTNRVDCHFCNGVWRAEEPAKHKSKCPLDAILGESG